jgi:hypothetical protein
LLASIALSACSGAPQPDAGAAPALAPAASIASDEDCIGCHASEAESWHASAHRTAFSDEVFQAEWAATEQAACVRCHAPLADPESPRGAEAELGVSCVTCHLREGEVLSVRASPSAPHPVRIDPSLSSEQACAGCHDFTFASVAPTPHDLGAPLQHTVHEWREVSDRGTCQSCHLRDAAGRVSHAMPGARDPRLLASALGIEARAERGASGTRVRLTLRSRAGHAVPTGDMYRRLEVRAYFEGGEIERGEIARTTLMRRFERIDGLLREVSDDRVPASGAREVVLELGRGRGPIHWEIEWQALEPSLAAQRWIPDEDARRPVIEGVID